MPAASQIDQLDQLLLLLLVLQLIVQISEAGVSVIGHNLRQADRLALIGLRLKAGRGLSFCRFVAVQVEVRDVFALLLQVER